MACKCINFIVCIVGPATIFLSAGEARRDWGADELLSPVGPHRRSLCRTFQPHKPLISQNSHRADLLVLLAELAVRLRPSSPVREVHSELNRYNKPEKEKQWHSSDILLLTAVQFDSQDGEQKWLRAHENLKLPMSIAIT